METYLMMLYVSLEQEKALKQFFQDNGWPFCKPDLSKTTDIIGPLSPTLPQIPKDQGNGEKGTVPGQPQHKDVNVMQDVKDTVPLETIVEIRGDNNTVMQNMVTYKEYIADEGNPEEKPTHGIEVEEHKHDKGVEKEILKDQIQTEENIDTDMEEKEDHKSKEEKFTAQMPGTDVRSEVIQREIKTNTQKVPGERKRKIIQLETPNSRKSGRLRKMSSKLRDTVEDGTEIVLKNMLKNNETSSTANVLVKKSKTGSVKPRSKINISTVVTAEAPPIKHHCSGDNLSGEHSDFSKTIDVAYSASDSSKKAFNNISTDMETKLLAEDLPNQFQFDGGHPEKSGLSEDSAFLPSQLSNNEVLQTAATCGESDTLHVQTADGSSQTIDLNKSSHENIIKIQDGLELSENMIDKHDIWVKEEEDIKQYTSTDLCPESQTNSQSKQHSHTKCVFCEKAYSQKDISEHFQTIHSMTTDNRKCPDGFYRRHYFCLTCNKLIGRVQKMISHIKKVHGSANLAPSAMKKKRRTKVTKKIKSLHMCFVCDETFESKTAVINHQKSAHAIKTEKNVTSPKEKLHVCEMCGKLFTRSDNLKYHVDVVHRGMKRYNKRSTSPSSRAVCDICGTSFARRGSLTEHLHSVHSQGPFEHRCEQCPRSFTRKSRLEYHMNRHHLNLKPYKCTKCNLTFFSVYSLKRHQIICNMTDSEKLECRECGHRVSNRHNLDMHIQAMHSEPALCCPCGTIVRWKSSISKHKRRCRLNKLRKTGQTDDEVLAEFEETITEQAENEMDGNTHMEVVSDPWGNEAMLETSESEHIETHVEEVGAEHVEIIVKEAVEGEMGVEIDAQEVVAAVEQVVGASTLELGAGEEVVYDGDSNITIQQVSQGDQKLYYIINYGK